MVGSYVGADDIGSHDGNRDGDAVGNTDGDTVGPVDDGILDGA